MKFKVYSMFDRKAKYFGQPMFLPNDEVLKRNVVVSLKQPNSQLAPVIEDMAFYHIGEFDDEKGVITPLVPTIVFDGVGLLPSSPVYGGVSDGNINRQREKRN